MIKQNHQNIPGIGGGGGAPIPGIGGGRGAPEIHTRN